MASKFGYGNMQDIDQALEEGKLNEQDLVITKDTLELVYITSEREKKIIKTIPLIFESINEANNYINNSENALRLYSGQQILIKDNTGEYITYIIQKQNSRYVIEVMVPRLTWQTF